MKLSVKRTDIVILLMFLSYFIANPVLGELLLWISYIYLFFKCKSMEIHYTHKKVFLTIIFVYICLFAVQFFSNFQGIEYTIRLYGLTKNLMMLSLMILIWPSFSVSTAVMLSVASSIISIIYIITADFIGIYVSQNGVIALCTISIPFLLYDLLYGKKYFGIINLIPIIWLMLNSDSETLILILILQCVLFTCYVVFKKYRFARSRNILKLFGFLLFLGLVFIGYTAITNKSFYQRLYVLMLSINGDRAGIWHRGFTQYTQRAAFLKLFGNGDNHVQMEFIQHAGHNAVLEELLIYGLVGMVLFAVETLFMWKIFSTVQNKTCKYFLFMIMVAAYIEFLAHPFYSTYFIQKIFFMACIKAFIDISNRNGSMEEMKYEDIKKVT